MISISHHAAPKQLEADINNSQQSKECSQRQQIGPNIQRTALKITLRDIQPLYNWQVGDVGLERLNTESGTRRSNVQGVLEYRFTRQKSV